MPDASLAAPRTAEMRHGWRKCATYSSKPLFSPLDIAYHIRAMAENQTDRTPERGVSDSDFAEAVANPSSFTVDGLSQTNRSISDLIAADKYLRKRARAGRRRHPLSGMVSHLIPPGTCDR